jgi:hypothetical protein
VVVISQNHQALPNQAGISNNYVHFDGTLACSGVEEGWKELKRKYATQMLH